MQRQLESITVLDILGREYFCECTVPLEEWKCHVRKDRLFGSAWCAICRRPILGKGALDRACELAPPSGGTETRR